MTVIVNQIAPPAAYQGGTYNLSLNSRSNTSVVPMTDTTFVWTYYQNTPRAIHFMVVDMPGGWTNSGASSATKTFTRYDNERWLAARTTLQRLNDTTFVAFEFNGGGQIATVYKINADRTVSRVFNGTFNSINVFNIGQDISSSATFRLLSNNVLWLGYNDGNIGAGVVSWTKFTWDPTGNTLTMAAPVQNLAAPLYLNFYTEFTTQPIPNSTKFLFNVRTTNNGSGGLYAYTNTVSFLMNPDGTRNKILFGGANMGADVVPLSETRYVFCSEWGNPVYVTDTGVRESSQYLGTGSNADIYTSYPLSPDFFMMATRNPLTGVTTSPFRLKVFRRDDTNITSISPASVDAANNLGFPVTGLKSSLPFSDKNRPEFWSNGDLYWFGLNADTVYQLTWNVIKNP